MIILNLKDNLKVIVFAFENFGFSNEIYELINMAMLVKIMMHIAISLAHAQASNDKQL